MSISDREKRQQNGIDGAARAAARSGSKRGRDLGHAASSTMAPLDTLRDDRNGGLSAHESKLEISRQMEFLRQELDRAGAIVIDRFVHDAAYEQLAGYESRMPIFVLINRPYGHLSRFECSQSRFTYITDGIESAVARAGAIAGARGVTVVGDQTTAQQLILAGLVDELQIGATPHFFGDGLRFVQIEDASGSAPERSDVRFRVVRPVFKIQPH